MKNNKTLYDIKVAEKGIKQVMQKMNGTDIETKIYISNLKSHTSQAIIKY